MSSCKTLKSVLLTCLLLVTPAGLPAATLFEEDSILEVQLTGPMGKLIQDKEKRIELPFSLTIDDRQIDLKVRARGNSRMRVCDFPPLRFNFENSDTAGSPFEGQGKIKLVTRCRKTSSSKQDVLEEYAAYRIFGLLSDVSYRVRLLNITYDDTDNRIRDKYSQSHAFLIEPTKHMTSRVGGRISELPAVALSWMDDSQAALVYVFQYLVANTDWSFVSPDKDRDCCHNINLININGKQFPVPYDFDLAGLVNADYAFPDPSLRLRRVTIRRYLGFCTDTDVLREAIKTVNSSKQAILDVINGLPSLSDKEKTSRVDYLQRFFKEAQDEEKIISKFEKRCHS